MSKAIASVPIGDLTHKVTFEIEIVGYRGWLVRLSIAKFFMRLACRILGVNYGISEVEE